jgi:peptide/nickel transport system substrate-binding protein
MSHDDVGPRTVMRSVAFLAAGALAVSALVGCSADEDRSKPVAAQDIAPAARTVVADGGTLRWAVDAVPRTLNAFQADADASTTRVAGAVLPAMFRLDANGRPERDPDYLESAKVVSTEPKQVVVYRLNQQAVWSDGREIGADDFAAQWRALSGRDSAYWTARNAGYDRIENVERGANNLEVKVTFGKPYADWRSLFSPLYPKDVMGTANGFNDGARAALKATAGPFTLQGVDAKKGEVTLGRNPRWWGRPAKLDRIVLVAVPRDKRAAAIAAGSVDMAEIDPQDAGRIATAAKNKGSAAPQGSSPAATPQSASPGATAESASPDATAERASPDATAESASPGATGQSASPGATASGGPSAASGAAARKAQSDYVIRKSLEPAFTQLALNGSRAPLSDERVRRAVARALNREELAGLVLTPLRLPAVPVGSHLALSGQEAYADSSGALGDQDTGQAKELLSEAGWVLGGPVKEEKKTAGSGGKKAAGGKGAGDDGKNPVGEDDKGYRKDPGDHSKMQPGHKAGVPGAYAPKGTAAPGGNVKGALAKDGKALVLRFVLPSGPGSQTLRTVADRITRMLEKVGIRTEIVKVSDESYFKDHIASGDYDLALYSWPVSAFPATDARPIYAKPVPASDGTLSVEQNYTRVGTDQVDQLFDQAIATLNESEEHALMRKADARIWATASSIPLYQRPQLTAVRADLANAGSFGFQAPVYEDMGFLKKGVRPSASPSS